MQKTALVIIDIQNDITKNYKDIIDNLNRAIDWATKNKIHVVYIKHEFLLPIIKTFKKGTYGAELVSDLNIVSENIFIKFRANALTSKGFADFIRENEINHFYITGADAVACVKSTCCNLCKANYKVDVLSDCITSYNKRKLDKMLNCYEAKGCSIINLSNLELTEFNM